VTRAWSYHAVAEARKKRENIMPILRIVIVMSFSLAFGFVLSMLFHGDTNTAMLGAILMLLTFIVSYIATYFDTMKQRQEEELRKSMTIGSSPLSLRSAARDLTWIPERV
jgi:hypothetical protein